MDPSTFGMPTVGPVGPPPLAAGMYQPASEIPSEVTSRGPAGAPGLEVAATCSDCHTAHRISRTEIATGKVINYTWDHRNRLTKVNFKNSGGSVVKSVDFLYDAFNRLIRRTVDPDGATGSAALVDTILSWENDQINLQFDGSAASGRSNVTTVRPAARAKAPR